MLKFFFNKIFFSNYEKKKIINVSNALIYNLITKNKGLWQSTIKDNTYNIKYQRFVTSKFLSYLIMSNNFHNIVYLSTPKLGNGNYFKILNYFLGRQKFTSVMHLMCSKNTNILKIYLLTLKKNNNIVFLGDSKVRYSLLSFCIANKIVFVYNFFEAPRDSYIFFNNLLLLNMYFFYLSKKIYY